MTLHKIKDFNPEYKKHFNNHEIKGVGLYSGNEKIGTIDDVLVTDEGKFRYFVIDTGGWILGKKVLLPIGHTRLDRDLKRVDADRLTKAQVQALPEFTGDMQVDYDHEEQVRGVYRSSAPKMQQQQPAASGVGYAGADSAPATKTKIELEKSYAGYDRNTYAHEQEPDLYAMNEQNHPNMKLYEERLTATKTRQKTGETVISKRVETETANASIPIEKERVTIEHIPGNATAVSPGEANFQGGEVSRTEVYEEVPEFHKEAFVREEVRTNKVVDKETVTAQEQLRREEVDIKTQALPVTKKTKSTNKPNG